MRSQDFDRSFEGSQIGTLAVDAVAAVSLHDPPLKRRAHRKHLPGRQEMKRSADPMGRMSQGIRIVMERMIRSDQHASPGLKRRPHVLVAANLYVGDLGDAKHFTAHQRKPHSHQPRCHPRFPRLRRSGIRLLIHGPVVTPASFPQPAWPFQSRHRTCRRDRRVARFPHTGRRRT